MPQTQSPCGDPLTPFLTHFRASQLSRLREIASAKGQKVAPYLRDLLDEHLSGGRHPRDLAPKWAGPVTQCFEFRDLTDLPQTVFFEVGCVVADPLVDERGRPDSRPRWASGRIKLDEVDRATGERRRIEGAVIDFRQLTPGAPLEIRIGLDDGSRRTLQARPSWPLRSLSPADLWDSSI